LHEDSSSYVMVLEKKFKVSTIEQEDCNHIVIFLKNSKA